jgi:hypothetical protein
MHRAYLEDTLGFLTTGTRQMHMTNWLSLVTHSDVTNGTAPVSVLADRFFESNGRSGGTMLTSIIQRWVSQPGGLEDLVQSLKLLFGEI